MARMKPTAAELLAARGKKVPDLIRPDLSVLFVGINPSLYSAAVRQHFARPGNRFYKTLYRAGLTPRLLRPDEGAELLRQGLGITNLVARATATAAELSDEEYSHGFELLKVKLRRFRPATAAFLGVSAYRAARKMPKAKVGLQPELLCGSRVFVLPNPSGLNAHYQLEDLSRVYRELALSVRVARPLSGR
jgi:TDG/mug DNA glycosylase family protein